MTGTFTIDCFPESTERYRSGYAVIAIDVIRATTTATTALAAGRRVFPARTCDEASVRASSLLRPLLVGELGGNKPFGFDITNSPAELALRTDIERPMVFVSSSGTQLIVNATGSDAVVLACLRNYSGVARYLAGRYNRVAILGAGTRGEFRREDQIGCALVGQRLVEAGYAPSDERTHGYVERWREGYLEAISGGRSAEYLRRSGQERDLEFVLSHVDDLDTVPALVDGELLDVSHPGSGHARGRQMARTSGGAA